MRASFYFHRGDLSAAEIRSRARLYASRPIHLLKVYDGLSATGYRSLMEAAAELGLPVEGHVPRAVGLATAIRSGQRAVDHARDLPRACASPLKEKATPTEKLEHLVAAFDEARCRDVLDRMAAAGVWYVPTHVTREEDARADDPAYRTDDTQLDYLDPLSRWAWTDDAAAVRDRYPGQRGRQALDSYFAHGRRITGLAHSRGVRILVGTDTVLPGFRLHDEIAHLAAAGLDPMDVLKAATSEPADYAGLDDHLGDIAPGHLADLVLLDADPLADVTNTREIRAVVLAGRLYDRAALDDLFRFVARRARDPRVAARILRGFLTSPMSAEM